MKLRRVPCFFVAIAVLLPIPLLAAELFLMRVPAGVSTGSVEMLESRWSTRVLDAEVSPKLTVLLFTDGMPDSRWERVKAGLSVLRQSKSEPFRLFVAGNGALHTIEWSTPGEFNSQLGKHSPIAPPIPAPALVPLFRIPSMVLETDRWESILVVAEREYFGPETSDAYIEALTSHEFRTRRLRLFFWPVTDDLGARTNPDLSAEKVGTNITPAVSIWDAITAATCGRVLPGGDSPSLWLQRMDSTDCREIQFEGLSIPQGSLPYAARLTLGSTPPQHLSGILLGPSALPNSLAMHRELLQQTEAARSAYSARQAEPFQSALRSALDINPMHVPALILGAEAYANQRDWAAALQLLTPVSIVSPRDSAVWRQLGNFAFELKDWNTAEQHYGAVLKLDPELDDVRQRLIGIYKEGGNFVRVTELLDQRASTIGSNLELQMKYAAVAEDAGLKDSALKFFNLAVKTQPTYEPAHFGRARLFFEAGNLKEAHEAVVTGLSEAPDSARLRLIEIDILTRENRIYPLKAAVERARQIAPRDEGVLRRAAGVSELFGDNPARAYQAWTEALASEDSSSPTLRSELERGIMIALRDGDPQSAKEMSARLDRIGGSRVSELIRGPGRPTATSTTVIPGGVKALAQAAAVSGDISEDRFLVEYAKALLRNRNGTAEARTEFEQRLAEYFELVRELEAQNQTGTSAREIALDVSTAQGMQHAQRILNLLGWQIRKRGAEIIVEVREGAQNTHRQGFVSSLGIDEADMKLSLEAMKPYTIRVQNGRVPVVLDESFWTSLYSKNEKTRGLLEQMFRNPALARLYVGLSSMNAATQSAVVEAVGAEELTRRATRLSYYGASIAIEDGGLLLPGGRETRAAWEGLARSSPDNIGEFLRNLIGKDDGKLLAYYYNLAALPTAQQRFFTRTASRLSAFYKAFPFSDETTLEQGMFIRRDDPFVRLARELPLDDAGNVDFPGNARIWVVARGDSNIRTVDTLIGRIDRTSTPDVEDELLLNMLGTTYAGAHGRKINQIENFLAVVRINKHRRQPMDERMALSLTQSYAKYHSVFPYFAAFTELTGVQAVTFFRAAERLERFEGVELNNALGHFHGLLKLTLLLDKAEALTDSKAAELFAAICGRFADVRTYRDIAGQSFDLLDQIVRETEGSAGGSAEDVLLRHFAGTPEENQFIWDGAIRSVNVSARHARRMDEVLRLQSISSLDALLQVYRASAALMKSPGAPALAQIEENVPRLIELAPLRGEKIPGNFIEQLIIARPEEVAKIVARLNKEMAEDKVSPRDVADLAGKLVEELGPFLKTTLTGWIYAYYFSPEDLAVANNKYLVRSHQFFDAATKDYWPETRVEQWEIGGRIVGGFSHIAAAMAVIATSKVDAADSISPTPTSLAQLAAVRSVPWSRMSERVVHLAALKIRIGREFLVHSAFNDELRRKLENATTGTIGITRRFELLEAIDAFDLDRVVTLLTHTDLFFLADTYIAAFDDAKSASPLLQIYDAERRRVSPEQLNYLGGYHPGIDGCVDPHLSNPGPYEDYANLFSPEPLGQRLSDILLALAESADRNGLPAAVVALLGEKAVYQFAHRTHNHPPQDWMSAIDALRSIELGTLVAPLLERP